MRRLLIVLLISGLSTLMLTGCNEGPLLSSLNQRQSNEVLAALHKHHIQAVKIPQGKGLFSVTVPEEQSRYAIRVLQEYQLPSNERVEIAGAFPADSLIASPQSEKARLISAIEQRLEQSINSFTEVAETRVHLSYPMAEPRKKHAEPPRASVLIYHTGIEDEDGFTRNIQTFVMNAFSGLDEEHISVILHYKPLVISPPSEQERVPFSPLGLLLSLAGLLLTGGIFYLQRSRIRTFLINLREKRNG
ncbi:type III secretion inner membrane ring lipoprotein SctJ [Morganella psychrotolerans]|uniref:Lipoprotein n=1 Tax=Morganella psychrotolerans TaxID=368603 RepID=A0A5M9R662_9GAMM|nr:type III secretion inner membrane ring lipoprotein SctJ [Morganella psychrotolerans]KAA8715416.1 EscJ/YscJ/HrcJ family type III secretion inner membrane ring protein [Morganella psychrotolerans]OBU05464.1 EscJ/YscJ/HrcJ family type III secretion inner membrane ring protein [Morganella psychrotolerans]